MILPYNIEEGCEPMANPFFPKGQVWMPYDRQMLERAVSASQGVMKPGCKFQCPMYSSETPGMWSLPCIFRCSFVSLDEGIRINYRVFPGWIVWLLLVLPVAALAGLIWMDFAVEFTGIFGAVIGLVAFAYSYQRRKAIERFVKRFGK